MTKQQLDNLINNIELFQKSLNELYTHIFQHLADTNLGQVRTFKWLDHTEAAVNRKQLLNQLSLLQDHIEKDALELKNWLIQNFPDVAFNAEFQDILANKTVFSTKIELTMEPEKTNVQRFIAREKSQQLLKLIVLVLITPELWPLYMASRLDATQLIKMLRQHRPSVEAHRPIEQLNIILNSLIAQTPY